MTAPDGGHAPDRLAAWLDAHFDDLVAVRRHLHSHPELSRQEHATTEFLTQRLEIAGLEPRVLAAGTGLVCDVGAGSSRGAAQPVVALRAEIDALAMEDQKEVHYRSRRPGVAHACGHDVHTTAVLGAGLALAELFADRADSGCVRLIFQPAEETVPGGALEVIADGGLDGVDAIFAVHCDPKLDVGRVGTRPGPMSSAADMVELALSGPGGHTARPERTVDLVGLVASVIGELPARAAERAGADGALQLVFGAVRAGEAANVIPARAVIRGSVRTPDRDVWGRAPELIEQVVAEIVEPSGGAFEIDYTRGVPPVVNERRATGILEAAAVDTLGADAVVPAVQSAGGDDFAWYLERVAGSLARLGVHDPASGAPRLDLHASRFDVDERAIAVGVRLLVATARRALASPQRI